MTKFKFGDKVWHDEYGVCIYHYNLGYKDMCSVITETNGSKKVSENNLTKASDWIPCSERIPEFNVRVLVVSGNRFSYDFLLDIGTHSEWASLESWDYWMYAPEMPEVKE